MTVPFLKMHGAGNDFVVIDGRENGFRLTESQARAIGDRRRGVGFDQLLQIEPPVNDLADGFMRIFNPDGSQAGACGNGTRCVAWLLMQELGRDHVIVETVAGLLDSESAGEQLVTVDMGQARLDWREVPLKEARDTAHLEIGIGDMQDPVGVSMGNPHAVFFVDEVGRIPLAEHGPLMEKHPLFPEGANIEIAEVRDAETIRLRVWERGAGITMACGSGACATLVAAARRGLTGRRATILVDGGKLVCEWLPDGHVTMTGPVATSFSGALDRSLLQ